MDKEYKWDTVDPIKTRLPYIVTANPFASGHWLTYYIDQHDDFENNDVDQQLINKLITVNLLGNC